MYDLLNYDDCIILDRICNITIDICQLYEELYKLEIFDLKEINEYKNKLELLKNKVSKEDKLYSSIEDLNDVTRISTAILYSYNKKVEIDTKNMLNQYRNKDYDDIARKRIVRKLYNRFSIEMSKGLKFNLEDKFMIFDEIKKKKFYSILENSIGNSDGNIDKNILIYEKYFNALYISSDENILLNNNFYIEDLDEVSNVDFNDMNNIVLKLEVMDTIRKEIVRLLDLTDEDYEDSDTKVILSIDILYLRSFMMLLNEDMVNDINIWFHEYIESFGYLSKHKFDKKYKNTEEYIINAFKKYNDDRAKYLSRKRTKNQ